MTKAVKCGNVIIGGGAPCSIQSMTNTDTRDVKATVAQIHELEAAGCEIVRVAVPDIEAATALKMIKKSINLPLVADIHFDYRLALESIKNGVDKIRINPGNIGSRDRVEAVVKAAKANHIPIRIGVNSGSLKKEILEEKGVCAEALVQSALEEIKLLEELDFYDIVVSLKSSDVKMNLLAYRMISQQTDYPLHVGVTESGTVQSGIIKSAVGIGALILDGIGDTMRVSLTGSPLNEIPVARRILEAAGARRPNIEFVSCPTCGRTKVNLERITADIEERLVGIQTKKPIVLAVMGCEVNGPGEARSADLGVACGAGKGLIFSKGKALMTVGESEIVPTLEKMIKEM